MKYFLWFLLSVPFFFSTPTYSNETFQSDVLKVPDLNFGNNQAIREGCKILSGFPISHSLTNPQKVSMWLCAGGIGATVQLMLTHREMCPPPNFTNSKYAQIVSAYLEEHPRASKEQFSLTMEDAIKAALPCTREK